MNEVTITYENFVHLIDYHSDQYSMNCIIKCEDSPGKSLRVVWLKSLKDFDFRNYDVMDDIVVMFRDCGHVFTFGEVSAYLNDKNTIRGCNNTDVNDDIYSSTIAFGEGGSSNFGLGYAIALGGGMAQAYYRTIAIGKNKSFLNDLSTKDYNKYFIRGKFNGRLKSRCAYNYPIFDREHIPFIKMFKIYYKHGCFLSFNYYKHGRFLSFNGNWFIHKPGCIQRIIWKPLVNKKMKTKNELIVNFINYPPPGETKNENDHS